jgi:hypothetical protein
MDNRLRTFLLIFSFSVAALSAMVAQPRFFLEISQREVVANEPFQVRFTLEGASGGQFRPPDWNGLEVLQGPNRSMQTTIINGQMSSQASYSFLISAPKPGRYEIGGASIEAGGQRLRSEPLKIEALAGRKPVDPGSLPDEPYFIRATLDTAVAYTGQQVILEYKLYTTAEINSYDVLRAPSFEGVYYRELPLFQGRAVREEFGGVSYSTRVLRRLAIFPQQSGRISIEPMVFQLGVIERDKNQRSFFFSSRLKPVQLSSEALELRVVPHPEPVPENFSEGVGRFAVSTHWDKSRLSTREALTLTLTVSGDGDPKQLSAPALVFPEEFEQYPPRLLREETSETTGRLLVTKAWQYVLVPNRPGQYELGLEMAFLDPDSGRYVTKEIQPWKLAVSQGAGGAKVEEPRSDGDALHPPDLYTQHKPVGKLYWASTGYWLLASLPLLVLFMVYWMRHLREKEAQESPEERNYRRASKEAQALLASARQEMLTDNPGPFYRAAAEAFLGYAAHRLRVSPNSVTRGAMRKYLVEKAVPQETIDSFIAFWDQLDAAQYAPGMQSTPMKEVYAKAIQLVSKLEAILEKV